MSKFFTRFNPPPSPVTFTPGRSMTHQEFAAECDINTVVARMGAGIAPQRVAEGAPYADVTAAPATLEEALQVVEDARARFEALPSAVRDRFGNSPQALLGFLADPSNRPEAERLGLVPPGRSTAAPQALLSDDQGASTPSA